MVRPFSKILHKGILSHGPGFYLYQFNEADYPRRGVIGLVPLNWLAQGKIVKHELTCSDKVERYVEAFKRDKIQTTPVLLVYPNSQLIHNLLELVAASNAEPSTQDGPHQVKEIKGIELIHYLVKIYSEIKVYYVADGHHRLDALLKLAKFGASDYSNWHFLACLMEESQILTRNYAKLILKFAEQYSLRDFFKMIGQNFQMTLLEKDVLRMNPLPQESFMYANRRWFSLALKDKLKKLSADYNIPQTAISKYIFEDGLNITSDKQNQFIASIKQEEHLENISEYAKQCNFPAAFCFKPLIPKDIFNFADLRKIFPVNTTYFEPKISNTLINFSLGQYFNLPDTLAVPRQMASINLPICTVV